MLLFGVLGKMAWLKLNCSIYFEKEFGRIYSTPFVSGGSWGVVVAHW
jgi:hypothetical protein